MEKNSASLSDEELLEIIKKGKTDYSDNDISAAEEILLQRGMDIIELAQFKYDHTDVEEPEDKQGSLISPAERGKRISATAMPLLLGIIFLAFNYSVSSAIFDYNVTGKSSALANYGLGMGIAHDILLRLVILAIVTYYIERRNGKNLWVWIIIGIVFGAWTLIAVGFNELTRGSDEKEDLNTNEKNDTDITFLSKE